MGRRRKLTDEGVAKLEAKRKRYAYPDPEMPGLYIRVTPGGVKSFVVVVYDRGGKQRWLTIGKPGPYNIEQLASELVNLSGLSKRVGPSRTVSSLLLPNGASCIAKHASFAQSPRLIVSSSA
jgi:hypothetical protein